MKLFSERLKLAEAVEARMVQQEQEAGVRFTRGPFNTINQLEQMGWLRDQPLSSEERVMTEHEAIANASDPDGDREE